MLHDGGFIDLGNRTASLIDEIANAFQSLYQQSKLRQGNGVFDFGAFQIHI